MLITLFCFILIIEFTQSQQIDDVRQVIFNADNQWQEYINQTYQSIFLVKNLNTKYCYVRINLSQNDPSLLLMAEYQQLPNNSLLKQYKQGEKIDRISKLENRITRFLKLKSGMGDIYILVKANNTNNKYLISISGSNEEYCDNGCSKNGICQANGCNCQKSFIGNDCNQIAEELFVGTSKQLNLTTQESITFFYIDLRPLKEHTLRLDFSFSQTQPYYGYLALQICRMNLVLKNYFVLDYDDTYDSFNQQMNHYIIQEGTQRIITKVPSNLTNQLQILYFAIIKDCDTEDSAQLQMEIKYDDTFDKNDEYDSYYDNRDSDDNDETNKLLSIIIPTVVGSIIIFILICYYLRKNLRRRQNQPPNFEQPAPGRRLEQSVSHVPPVLPVPSVPPVPLRAPLPPLPPLHPPVPQLNPVNITQKKKEEQISDEPEQCAICLEGLNTKNKAVVTIGCNHQFHYQCIQEWGKQQGRKNGCPTCRGQFNPDEIQ